MRSRTVLLTLIVSALASLGAASPAQPGRLPSDRVETIRRMLNELHENDEFTGSVLVARAATILYRDATASTPDDARTLLATPSNIASLSKAFTAMMVMMLAERGKLRYDDLVARHVPELDGATPGVTLRHLLTHTSGLPDVGDLGIDRPGLRERDVLDAVKSHHQRFSRPGARYRYSNTGYMILAMVVENVSGQTFDDFLKAAILVPLGMTHTRSDPESRGPDDTKGAGGLASTVDDLLKWHHALAGETLVSAKTFADALVPAKVIEGESIYGFGWNVAQRDGQTYMWHTGNSGGQRAFLGRRIGDGIAIIILTNGNSRRTEIADAIVDILHGRAYVPPKLSVARQLLATIESQGVEAGLALYDQLKATVATRYDLSEPELNGLGYTLLGRGRNAEAIRVFEHNVRQFPTSANVFDSLGEALARSGRRDEAAKAYARALELDPANVNARAMLAKLKSDKP
jgi:CubicO group peptidase (beta-lactamase class C family)